jgi:hypothetical protein
VSACCCIDVANPVDYVWTTEVKKARMAHFCCECSRCIPPGAPYRKEVTIFEGNRTIYKTCKTCCSIRDDMFSCGFYYGRLYEHLYECLREFDDDDDDSWLDPPDWPIEVT